MMKKIIISPQKSLCNVMQECFSFINLIVIVCELKQIYPITLFNAGVFFQIWKQPTKLKILLFCIFLIYMSMIHELIKEKRMHSLIM